MQVSRASFHLLSNLCTVNLFIVMFQNVANVTSNSLQSGKTCVTSIKGAVLAKHDYASFVVQNMFACYYRCKGDMQCQSFNFYEKTQICELNNRTRIVGHLNFQPHQGAFYMDNPFRGNFRSLIMPYFVNSNYLIKIVENDPSFPQTVYQN